MFVSYTYYIHVLFSHVTLIILELYGVSHNMLFVLAITILSLYIINIVLLIITLT